LSMDKNQVYTI